MSEIVQANAGKDRKIRKICIYLYSHSINYIQAEILEPQEFAGTVSAKVSETELLFTILKKMEKHVDVDMLALMTPDKPLSFHIKCFQSN